MCLGKHFFNVLRNRGKEMSSRMSSAKNDFAPRLKVTYASLSLSVDFSLFDKSISPKCFQKCLDWKDFDTFRKARLRSLTDQNAMFEGGFIRNGDKPFQMTVLR